VPESDGPRRRTGTDLSTESYDTGSNVDSVTTSLLELDGLTRRYGKTVAMDDLRFEVRGGEVVGFLGPNGAGKTTAMRCVLGITEADAGEVRWNGSRIAYEQRLRFGYMPEERGLYPTMFVLEHLVYLARLHGIDRDVAAERARYWLDRLGIGDHDKKRVDSLSLGNQQRVQMIAALVHEPDLLVLDEPFSGLDPTGIETLSNVLAERAAAGVAVVFSSHQLDLVEHLCERVVIINKGRTVTSGSTDELTRSTNTLSVRVDNDESAQWAAQLPGAQLVDIEFGNARIVLDEGTSPDSVLDAACRAGSVLHFTFERKRLSEVFREAVR
jgi:ABC-2 type transport system ATP-binding protein